MPTTDHIGGRTPVAAAAILLSCVLFAGCGTGATDRDSPATPAEATPDQVTMRLLSYRPETLRAGAGARVTWRQEDPGTHTVTSGVVEQQPGGVMTRPDGRFDSGQIAEGGTFSVALDRPGTYPYFCSIHPSTMRGRLEIT